MEVPAGDDRHLHDLPRRTDAERRAYWAITRVGELQAEIERVNEWRRITVGAVS